MLVPVFINNADVLANPLDSSLSSLRQTYITILETNLASVAVVATDFLRLLHKANSSKVINIFSELKSIANQVTKRMGRYEVYGVEL